LEGRHTGLSPFRENVTDSPNWIPNNLATCPISTDVARAAAVLRAGGLVAFATETVYGLGADALDVDAVARIFAAKQRPHFDPLIVHVADRRWLERLTTGLPPQAATLADRFWPGPLTLVLPKTDLVPDLVTSGLPTVAVRIPAHPQALDLLRQVDLPIAAPSANPFGCLSPTRAEHVAEQLGDRVDFILDGGACQVGVESTVLQVDGDRCLLLRPGGLSVEQIESLVGPVTVPAESEHPAVSAPASPGRLPKHYAPRTPLQMTTDWRDALEALPGERRVGLLSLLPVDDSAHLAAVEVLSPTGDLTEAAANFFASLRRLDSSGLDLILAHPFPELGLGRALNDRLQRAAAK
jgi:L-threonylcarbamoyladenylate synthase